MKSQNIQEVKLKIKQRFKTHVFFEEINKFALSSNDDEKMKSIDSIETCLWDKILYIRKKKLHALV